MNRFLFKYAVEFFVLITGLLITFYIEDRNELNYKIDLKNQSLTRLIRNIETDVSDQTTNVFKVDKTIKYYDIIAERGDELFENDKDSLGYYLTAISRSSTIFLSNVEEYLTLRNSGLIELIESDTLVMLLQTRTAGFKAFKKVEDKIIDAEKDVADLVVKKTSKISTGDIEFRGYHHGRYSPYNYPEPLSDVEVNTIRKMASMCEFYRPFIQRFIQTDERLIELIQNEIPDFNEDEFEDYSKERILFSNELSE